jgi:hypothetical protein
MDEMSYWSALCRLVQRLRCWVRVASSARGVAPVERWGQTLTIPTTGYLEGPGGPVPMKDVEWVEVSTKRIHGGIAGRPRQMVDIEDHILSELRGAALKWELREAAWSVAGVFDEEPVKVIRFYNPSRLAPRDS